MGKIGQFGTTVFEVSSDKVLTFNDFQRSGEAKWADHEIIGKKSIPEFIAPANEEISFVVRLDLSLGVDPSAEILKLRRMRDSGQPDYLIVGNNVKMSHNKFVLTHIQENHKHLNNMGKTVQAELTLSFKEYPQYALVNVKANSKSVSTNSKTSTGNPKTTVTKKNTTQTTTKPKR